MKKLLSIFLIASCFCSCVFCQEKPKEERYISEYGRVCQTKSTYLELYPEKAVNALFDKSILSDTITIEIKIQSSIYDTREIKTQLVCRKRMEDAAYQDGWMSLVNWNMSDVFNHLSSSIYDLAEKIDISDKLEIELEKQMLIKEKDKIEKRINELNKGINKKNMDFNDIDLSNQQLKFK